MKHNNKISPDKKQNKQNNLRVLLAKPRGFCAGVDRAVRIVETALRQYGAPIYVRHEIVHNAHIVKQLAQKGAIFVETLDEIPQHKNADKKPHVIFSAHGVAPDIAAHAKMLGFHVLDATCPLVSKVHAEVQRHANAGRHIFLIGHPGHPEIIGTIGHIPSGSYTLITTIKDAQNIQLPPQTKTAYATQTTLSLSETADIILLLKKRFHDIAAPNGQDICYATTNRQNAVAEMAAQCDLFFILGSENSSNARRLVETAQAAGAVHARLINEAADINWAEISSNQVIGLSAGASTPEFLVQNTIAAMRARFDIDLIETDAPDENIIFKPPAELRQ